MVLSIASLDLTAVVFGIVPMSAGVGFLLWVGVLITAQAARTRTRPDEPTTTTMHTHHQILPRRNARRIYISSLPSSSSSSSA